MIDTSIEEFLRKKGLNGTFVLNGSKSEDSLTKLLNDYKTLLEQGQTYPLGDVVSSTET